MGDSLEVLRGFPASVRLALGSDLPRLQIGEIPLDSKPMKTVGPGVRELRAKDRDKQFRTVYLLAKSDDVVVLHSFVKKNQKNIQEEYRHSKGAIQVFQETLRNGV